MQPTELIWGHVPEVGILYPYGTRHDERRLFPLYQASPPATTSRTHTKCPLLQTCFHTLVHAHICEIREDFYSHN